MLDEFADLHYPELETDCAVGAPPHTTPRTAAAGPPCARAGLTWSARRAQSGVLSFGMGTAHQFVLNKQAPNK